jgi:hypothetical protein
MLGLSGWDQVRCSSKIPGPDVEGRFLKEVRAVTEEGKGGREPPLSSTVLGVDSHLTSSRNPGEGLVLWHGKEGGKRPYKY